MENYEKTSFLRWTRCFGIKRECLEAVECHSRGRVRFLASKAVYVRIEHFLEQLSRLYQAGLQERIEGYANSIQIEPTFIGKLKRFRFLSEVCRNMSGFPVQA